MPYLPDLNTYFHQSSLLIQAYPTTRITTKYSLPRKANPKSKSKPNHPNTTTEPNPTTTAQSKREPSATLTLKTFHPESGICLKYKTDKAAEVGRLINGLGRLAKGEDISMPSTVATRDAGDNMDIDQGPGAAAPKMEDKVVTGVPTVMQTTGSTAGGAKGGKKKGKGKK